MDVDDQFLLKMDKEHPFTPKMEGVRINSTQYRETQSTTTINGGSLVVATRKRGSGMT